MERVRDATSRRSAIVNPAARTVVEVLTVSPCLFPIDLWTSRSRSDIYLAHVASSSLISEF